MINSKCKICRRLGVKLFLKGEKCLSPKCLMIKKSYPPGEKRKRRMSSLSEYGKELREKQKLKNWYNLRERQFKKYVKETLKARRRQPTHRPPAEGGPLVEDATVLLIRKLESRLDNIVFRLGFASSRAQAKQLVSHGHFLVNGKRIDIPSHQLKKGDIIAVSPKFQKKPIAQNLKNSLKKYKTSSWLELNVEKLEGKVLNEPVIEEVAPPVEIPAIFEFYSK
jgi:small subunit ribosomal protein S4